MVKLSRFAAVNPHEDAEDGGTRMLEAAEAELIQVYQSAIADSLAGDAVKCELALRSLLSNGLVADGATEQLQQLQTLCRKNLAITVSKQQGREREALGLLKEATDSSPGDVGLVDKFGTLAARLGEWAAAKDAFFSGLEQDPTHRTMRKKLLEVLEHLDNQAVLGARSCSSNPSQALIRSLPEVSRAPITASVGVETPRKIVAEVAEWVGLLRHVGRLREMYRTGCPLIEVQVESLDNEIEIDLDLDEDDDAGDGEYAVPVEEGRVDHQETNGPADDPVRSEDKSCDEDEGSTLAWADSTLTPTGTRCLEGSASLPEDSKTSKNPSHVPRRTRQQAAGELEGVHEQTNARKMSAMSMLDELDAFVGSPSSNFVCARDIEVGLGVDDNGVQSVLPVHRANSMLMSCSGIEWSLDALCELLVLYFSQSDELAKLRDADCRLLVDLIEAMDHPLPLDNAITASEWVVEKFCDIKERSLGNGPSTESVESDLHRLQSLSERLLLRVAVEVTPRAGYDANVGSCGTNEHFACDIVGIDDAESSDIETAVDVGASGKAVVAARYLFAKGKLMQALDDTDQAKDCYAACLSIISTTGLQIRLDHLQDHGTITAPCVRFILESVDVQSEMGKIRSQSDNQPDLRDRLVALSAKILSGPETESLMLRVDPSGWKNILSALIDASVKSGNTSTTLKCQIRLLHAMLPTGNPEDAQMARQEPVKFLEPVFHVSFTSRLLNATQLDKIIYCIDHEDIKLNDYELDMLVDVLRRLLVTMHACHTILCSTAESPSPSQDRGVSKNCSVILTYTSAFFLALLSVLWSRGSIEREGDLVPALDKLFDELGRLNLLLARKSMVPYFVTPLLSKIQAKCDPNAPYMGVLEDQIVHMLKFAFNVSLAPDAEISSYAASLTALKPRSITSEHEVRMIWPLCEDVLTSYSTKMVKDRAGRFVEECFAVAAESLPTAVKTQMTAAVQKCGLQRPGKVCSPILHSPFMHLSHLLEPGTAFEGGSCDNLVGGASDGQRNRPLPSPTIEPEVGHILASIFDVSIKLSPIDPSVIDRQTDVAGVDALEQDIEPYLWGLAFNPDNTNYWFAMGEFFLTLGRKVSDLCFLEGRLPTIAESAEILRRRNIAYWCLSIAGYCADKELPSLTHEDEGRRESLAGMFDVYGRALMGESTECMERGGSRECRRQALDESLSAFIAATRFFPNKYSYHMHIGVCSKLLGHPPREYLPALAFACELAQQDPRGTTFIDPLFELHAARMELLENGEEGLDEETKALCCLYPFLAPAGSLATDADGTRSTPMSNFDIQSAYKDALAAMEWCLEANRGYYKPSLRIVSSPLSDARARCEHLDLLFSNKTSRNFTIGVCQVQERGPHLQRGQKGKRKRSAGAADRAPLAIVSQEQAQAEFFKCDRYPTGRCAATMVPAGKNLGIGSDGTDTLRGHFLVTIRHALLEYVAVLHDLGHVDRLEEIATFLEKEDNECLKLAEFTDVIAYCRGSRMLLALQRATGCFPSRTLSEIGPENFLSGYLENQRILPCTHLETRPGLGADCRACLEHAYDMYVDSIACPPLERASRIMQPVAKYMRWRLSRGDLSDVDEFCGKMLVTNRGLGLLARYACVHVCMLAKEISDGEENDCSTIQSLRSVYTDFLQRVVRVPSRIGLLGLVLLSHCHHHLSEKSDEMNDMCLSHARECVQPLLDDFENETKGDPLGRLRSSIKDLILPEGRDDEEDDVNSEETGQPGDGDSFERDGGKNQDDGGDKDDGGLDQEGTTDVMPAAGGIAAMALAAMTER